MKTTPHVIDRLSELYEIAPDDLRINIDRLFQDLIFRIRDSIDFEKIRPLIDTIPLYSDRENRSQSSMSFFNEHYRDLILSETFYVDDLRHHDRKLYVTLSSYQAERGAKLSDLLPLRPRPTRGGPKPITALRA